MHGFWRPLLFFIFILGFFPVRVFAAKSGQCERRFIVDLVDFEPLLIRKQTGRVEGLSLDLVAELRKRTGCIYHTVDNSMPVINDNFATGRSDLILLTVSKALNVPLGSFVPLYSNNMEILIARKVYKEGRTLDDYVDDRKIKFAYLIGGFNIVGQKKEKEMLRANRLISMPSPAKAFEYLLQDRVQALLFTGVINSYYIKKLNLEDKVVRIPHASEKIIVGSLISNRRVNEQERKMLEKTFNDIKRDGTLLRIMSKYVSFEDAKSRMIEEPGK